MTGRSITGNRVRIWTAPSTLLPGLLILLGGCVLASLVLGQYPIPLSDVVVYFKECFFPGAEMDTAKHQLLGSIIWDIRVPRILAAALIGAALSISGAAFQSMFVNPLVSPGILGVLPGASFGAAFGLLTAGSWAGVQLCAFTGGLLAVGLALALGRFYQGDKLLMLILGGIISGSLFTSLLAIVKYSADPTDQLPAIIYWLMGGLSMVDMATVRASAGPIVFGIVCLLFMSRYLNIMSMGDEEAKTLGVNVGLVRFWLIFFSTVISALTVAIGGLIGWVGLVIPHVGRMLVGPNNNILLPVSAIIGAVYLVIVDDFSRLLFDVEIPLSIITSLVGIPFFSLVLKNAKKGWR